MARQVPDVSWPAGRAPDVADRLELGPGETAAPGTFPIPDGRGRWRLTLHNRAFTAAVGWQTGVRAELVHARSRRLEKVWNQPAKLSFSLDGHDPAAALIDELQTDVRAWRWDDQYGRDVCMFRGIIAQTEDELSEQKHTLNVVAHDYLKMLQRRMLTISYGAPVLNADQDDHVLTIMTYVPSGDNPPDVPVFFGPGAFLPILYRLNYPDGRPDRPKSGRLRDRTYAGQQFVGTLLDEMANLIDGYDYDVLPSGPPWPSPFVTPIYPNAEDWLRIFYPYQGEDRTDVALVYGSTVAALTRSVNSGDYANYWRVIGDNGSTDPLVPQVAAAAWNADANDVTRIPIGLWMSGDDAADVSIVSTLRAKALGNLAQSGQIVASFSLTLRPGAYHYGAPNMGDTVPLIVQSGRLNIDTRVRVLGITYAINDDADEDVELTVGRPRAELLELLTRTDRTVAALTRR
jgi:hypothetical protein